MVCFLVSFQEFFQIQIPDETRITLHTDSAALITGVKKMKDRVVTKPSDFTVPDQNVILATLVSLEQLSEITICHVKSHQDREKDIAELPLNTRLNIRADDLATKVLEAQENTTIPTMITLPACAAYLIADGEHVCSHEKKTLRQARPAKRLIHYMKEKHKWSHEVFQDINMEAYGAMIAKIPEGKKKFVIKFCHHWLPNCERVKQYGAKDDTCGNCNEVDTNDHFLQCKQQTEWKKKFLANLHHHLRTQKTEKFLKRMILRNSAAWLMEKSITTHGQQSKIGWNNFFRRYITQKWGRRQSRYFSEIEPKNKKYSGKRWTKSLFAFLWKHMHQRWIDRCAKLHDPASEGGGRLHAELVHRIMAMYELKERVNRFDQAIFAIPLQDRLLLSTRQLKIWATQFTPVIAKAVVTAQLRGMKGT